MQCSSTQKVGGYGLRMILVLSVDTVGKKRVTVLY